MKKTVSIILIAIIGFLIGCAEAPNLIKQENSFTPISTPSHSSLENSSAVTSVSSEISNAESSLVLKRPASDYSAQTQIQLKKEQESLLQAHTQYPVLSIKESVQVFSPNRNSSIISILSYEETIAEEFAEDVFYYFLNDYDTLLHRALWATYQYHPLWLNEDLVLLDGVELYSVSQKSRTRIIIPDHARKDNEYYHSIAVTGYIKAKSLHIIYYFQYDYHNYLYAYDIENEKWTHLCDFPFTVMTTAPASTEMEWLDEMVIAFNDESGRQCLYDFETGRLQLP